YWLMKAEPESRFVKGVDVKFSIDDLDNMPNKISSWDGVRNYEARNILRDKMKVGDLALFYHSSCKIPGIAGVVKVVREGYPDHTACDPEHPYFDAKVKAKDPAKWYMVDVQLVKKLDRFVPLKELQAYKSGPLSSMSLLSRGRLSIQPVTESEFEFIQGLANRPLETT
ncbi:PUA-like domain-containing protein, partial [Dimargaris cristalligena]